MKHSPNFKTNTSIPADLIDQIRAQSDIVEIIGEHGIHLKSAGKDFKGLCPFHDEKTPSFTVSHGRQMFYCFGCQAGGNVISFVQRLEGKSFVETIEYLAERSGIALPTPDAKTHQAQQKRRKLQDLNQIAIGFFRQNLMAPSIGGRTLAYLRKRGISDRTIEDFQLGFIPAGQRQLIQFAQQKGFSAQQLVDVGLAKEDRRGTIDRFRNRVIFPIFDERNRPVAFGGRGTTDDIRPKYLNSANTIIYDKSKTLYNLHNARKEIHQTGVAILVEGYFDAITLYQAGLRNVVASLGTAFSESHARLLNRFADQVIIIYDGDVAGLRAATRGLNTLIKVGLQVRVSLLPEGDDPDEFVKNHGVKAFQSYLDKSLNLIEFQIQLAVEQGAIQRIDVKSKAVKEIAATLASLDSPVELNAYVNQVAGELDLDRAVVYQELVRLGVKPTVEEKSTSKRLAPVRHQVSARESIEWQLLESLILDPSLIPKAKDKFNIQDLHNKTYAKVGQLLYESELVEIGELVNHCDESSKAIISQALMTDQVPPNLEARMVGCIKRLNQFLLLDFEKQMRSSALAEGKNNTATLVELVELSNRRRLVEKDVRR